MSNYAIMRIEKRRDLGSVRRMADHHLRGKPVPNADPHRTIRVLAGSSEPGQVVELVDTITRPLMKRKDAVRCLDVFIGTSPEWWSEGPGDLEAFERHAMDWARSEFGADNIVCGVLHLDEKTPHIQLLVTPVTKDGRLAAKDFVGTPRKLRDMQTRFADAMKPLGLQRGVMGSTARHETIRHWYTTLEPRSREATAIIAEAEKALEAAKVVEADRRKLAQARDELQRWELDLRRRSDELSQQADALADAFAELPAQVQAKLAAIFGLETPQEAPEARNAQRATDLPDTRKKSPVRPSRKLS